MTLSPFEQFLSALPTHVLLEALADKSSIMPLNLSLTNTALQTVDLSSSKALEVYIWNEMARQQAKVAVGGYLEHRGLYRRSTYFKPLDDATERNIHLGLDVWAEVDTPILAPLKGSIHSFNNNTNHGDYGPTLILKHKIDGFEFYTLYGHLSLASMSSWRVGEVVNQGQQIGNLGAAEVNGDYPPHLHFQIIRAIQDFKGDYPGVSNLKDIAFYKENCPDPNLLLGLTM
ncbi:MAG: peptidoglycan DD-metalloendopeptidase family protein [Winogradskyella arenosi]